MYVNHKHRTCCEWVDLMAEYLRPLLGVVRQALALGVSYQTVLHGWRLFEVCYREWSDVALSLPQCSSAFEGHGCSRAPLPYLGEHTWMN
jgi:hypothetical protein